MRDLSIASLDAILALEPTADIAPSDGMFQQGNRLHYFGVGRSALLSIISALIARGQFATDDGQPRTMLDFGCGHGRVARFLRAAFPAARLEVTDHNQDGSHWCVDRLGCQEMGDAIPRERYDLIWVGSVLTHLPERHAVSLIADLTQSLRPFGVLVFTTHGRVSAVHLEALVAGSQAHHSIMYGLAPKDAAVLVESYHRTGFGYIDYPKQTDYGVAVGKPSWYIDRTVDDETLLLTAQERGWDNHQDVFSFIRTPADVMSLARGRWFVPMLPQLKPGSGL